MANDVTHYKKLLVRFRLIPTYKILTVNSKDGIGVILLTWIKENRSGKWPSWEPMRNKRDEVKSIPFTPPKVERATKIGTIQANEPKVLFPNDLKKLKLWNIFT